jgi:hypothetical protein
MKGALRRKVMKQRKLKYFGAIQFPTLLYESEIKINIQAAKMKFSRSF